MGTPAHLFVVVEGSDEFKFSSVTWKDPRVTFESLQGLYTCVVLDRVASRVCRVAGMEVSQFLDNDQVRVECEPDTS